MRPLLLARCSGCHSQGNAKGGLTLLTRDGLLKGGAHGPAVLPGNPDASLMIQAVRHQGRQMPPAGMLTQGEIASLTDWVRMGAPWPRDPGTMAGKPARHWAFEPVRRPPIPAVKAHGWVRTPIDAFVLARLEARGLKPAPPADARTLIRRVYFDLLGLPPTSAEVSAFVRECGSAGKGTAAGPGVPTAVYARLVDRLLASPAYGERWGRYWLDVARYADTKDYVYFGERSFPFSYTYRDYVIRSLNEDKPYDRFLLEQIAGDCLPPGSDRRDLAALGFLTLGRRFVNNQADLVDDRIDVVFRGTQGLTVTCARCHDHKFDPIPTRDYYSLYGVFAASTEQTVPIGPEPPRSPAYVTYAAERAKRAEKLHRAMQHRRAELSARLRRKVDAYLAQVPHAQNLPGEETYLVLRAEDINPVIVRRWRSYIDGRHDAIFEPWHAFERLSPAEFSRRAPSLARRIARSAGRGVHPRVAALFAGPAPQKMAEVAARYGALLRSVAGEDGTGTAHADPKLRAVLFGLDSPATVPDAPLSQIEALFPEVARQELNALQGKLEHWDLQSPVAAPHALVLKDLPNHPLPRIFKRGNPTNPGPVVPRQLPALLSRGAQKPFQHGSGRLELARAIASTDNPLTARVMVNRVWLGHFGRGLVTTPSDFGTHGAPPSHPELLDWLAASFAGVPRSGSRVPGSPSTKGHAEPGTGNSELNWSLKRLHRLILLSNVYQQSSADHEAGLAADPENTLLWRMNGRRLDFEAVRDTLLAVSGQLDSRLGGRPVDLTARPYTHRRTVYGLVDRQNLPGLYRAFDFPTPDRHNPQRFATTSPQQSLFFMNSSFARQCAQSLVARPEVSSAATAAARIREMYELLYQREPSPRQLRLGLEYLGSAAGSQSGTTWERYAQALLMTNELVFTD